MFVEIRLVGTAQCSLFCQLICNDSCNQWQVVSCSDDGAIMVWSPGSWTCARSVMGNEDGAVNALVSCAIHIVSFSIVMLFDFE